MNDIGGYHPTFVYSFYSFWLASTCYFIFKILMEKSYSRKMIENVKNRKQKSLSSFKTFHEQVVESKIDDETIHKITSLSFLELREALQKDELTPTKVQLAYADLICRVNSEVNCVTDCIVESFDMAENLEKKYGKLSEKPYLYGVPFSVKSNFHLKGYDCCIGLSKFLTDIKKENCTMVEILIRLGAVPICITNVPQGLMSFMCSNPIFGTTENPYKKGFSPGGSSGGEACLVAKNGIPFGIGSDLAGSLRIPAQMSGVISLKPTEQRFGITNAHGGMPGKTRIGLSYGFFTHTVDEQIDLFNVVLNSEHYKILKTPNSVYLKFDMSEAEKQLKTGLKIGYYKFNGFIQPVPACARAVEEVVEKLKKQGHEMIEFTIPNPMKMANLVLSNIACDGGTYWKEIFASENIDPYMKQFVQMIKIPNFIRTMASYALSSFSPEMALMSGVNVSSSADVRQMQEDTDIYRKEFNKTWNSLGLDALIAPAFPTTAIPHEYPAKLGLIAVETALYNVLDYPAGVVPVTKVTKDDIENLNDEKIFPTGWNLTKLDMKKASQETENLPVGVQIVTQPFEEEKCLALMKQVQEIMGKIN